MPLPDETQLRLKHFETYFEELIATALRQQGFPKTLKSLNKGRLPSGELHTVHEGVLEELPSGYVDAALQTDKGRVVLRNARRDDRVSSDPQLVGAEPIRKASDKDRVVSRPEELLGELAAAGDNPPCELLCAIELAAFGPKERNVILPLLWKYILNHRDCNNSDELIAVAAAVRKYVAIMPLDQMGDLTVLLEAGHRLPVPIELEIELAKMIYRNFEVHPPKTPDPYPELSKRLWEVAQAYLNPRLLLRDKYAAAASLAVNSIIAMQSVLAGDALHAALSSPYQWFAEVVTDDMEVLVHAWSQSDPSAAAWLQGILRDEMASATHT